MAEVSGQQREPFRDADAVAEPAQQRGNGEGMSCVMDAGPGAAGTGSKAACRAMRVNVTLTLLCRSRVPVLDTSSASLAGRGNTWSRKSR